MSFLPLNLGYPVCSLKNFDMRYPYYKLHLSKTIYQHLSTIHTFSSKSDYSNYCNLFYSKKCFHSYIYQFYMLKDDYAQIYNIQMFSEPVLPVAYWDKSDICML